MRWIMALVLAAAFTLVGCGDEGSSGGSVGGCIGAIDAAVSTISCPNVAPYPGTVMVSDPDGNDSVPVAFTVGVCETDSCTTDPDTCG
jgi:hypothetical protein